MSNCKHPIWKYMGAYYWVGDKYEQRHKCIDCGHEERDVPVGGVMIGHAPGECDVCDRGAEVIPAEQRARWAELTTEQRS